MEFGAFKKVFQANLTSLVKNGGPLFVTDVDKDVLWNTYLDSFPEGTNPIYRERREYDCNCCRHFIRSFGNVVAIKNNKMVSIWDFVIDDSTFGPVMTALDELVARSKICDVFVTDTTTFGTDTTKSLSPTGHIEKWEHFYIKLPSSGSYVNRTSQSIASVMGELRTTKEVFTRSLKEISVEAIETVLELISQQLYKGEEWREQLKKFLKIKREYIRLPDTKREGYCWSKSVEVGPAVARIKNHSIGVLLTDIAGGMDIETAVKRYEKIVAPANYKRPKPLYTPKMVENAKKVIADLGFEPSLLRRSATLDDIRVNNIIYINRDSATRIKKQGTGDVFAKLIDTAPTKGKSFDRVTEVSIEKFINEIIPTATNIEAYVENRHSGNFVSLIAPQVGDSKTMFKWYNNFSWAYNGNVTDSMKELVKAAGGNVEGVLRFTIVWNENSDNRNDFDAHCKEPVGGAHIYYGNKGRKHPSSGMLDVDIIEPDKKQVAVENIIYTDITRMREGNYQFDVNTFSYRGGTSGFRAELEFDGQISSYEYTAPTRTGDNVGVVTVNYTKKGGFKIVKSLPSTTSSKEIWGIKTNNFVPVSVCMLSPNYWDEKTGVGNKHYFFMLDQCVNDTAPNGFFNEFLIEELNPHRHVFEALGSVMKVDVVDDQLSGLGFSSTLQNSLICRVTGKFTSIVKVMF